MTCAHRTRLKLAYNVVCQLRRTFSSLRTMHYNAQQIRSFALGHPHAEQLIQILYENGLYAMYHFGNINKIVSDKYRKDHMQHS